VRGLAGVSVVGQSFESYRYMEQGTVSPPGNGPTARSSRSPGFMCVQLISGRGRGTVGADQVEWMTAEGQPQMAGVGGVDQPPPLDLPGRNLHLRFWNAIDEKHLALVPEQLLGWGELPAPVQFGVVDEQHAFPVKGCFLRITDHEHTAEAAVGLSGGGVG